MVTYLPNYLQTRYQTSSNDYYNGVVRVSYNGHYATGSLLFDGRSIITAAHLFDTIISDNSVTVYIQTASGETKYTGEINIYDNYDPKNANGDLAIVHLESAAPQDAQRYSLYRDNDEIGQTFTMVGYGAPGSGSTGIDKTYTGSPLKLKTDNSFDADFLDITQNSSSHLIWAPWQGSQLAADFDDGTKVHDAIGQITHTIDYGEGIFEGLIAPGDSGGPAFISGTIAGIATYITRADANGLSTDSNDTIDASFGEIGSWQRMSYFQEWVDKSIRASYVDAPIKSEDVVKSIAEGGNSEISIVYFFVEYMGLRSAISEPISVDYSTREGTALAGEDFIETHGSLILYPDESSAVIAVEIIGDNIAEDNEYFYLDIYNPSHGSFGEDVTILSAMRTIINDDCIC